MDSNRSRYTFRPHHFLCTLGFEGKGYSDAFVENYQAIADSLRKMGPEGDQVLIEVVTVSDSICGPCPNRRGQECESGGKIRQLDEAHARVLGLKAGDRLTWGEAKTRIAERMSFDAFHDACAPCAWKSMGVCEAALKRVKEKDEC